MCLLFKPLHVLQRPLLAVAAAVSALPARCHLPATNGAAVPLALPPHVAQDYVQLDAAVVAGDTAYVGEFKRVLGEGAVLDLNTKVEKIRCGRLGQQGACDRRCRA